MILLKPKGQILRELAERCEAARLSLRISQKELALRAGLSIYTYHRFVRDGQISLGRFVAVLEVLQRLDEVDGLLRYRPTQNPYEQKSVPQRVRQRKAKA
jgi:transcriptional regulator with XRE-family HTH domain